MYRSRAPGPMRLACRPDGRNRLRRRRRRSRLIARRWGRNNGEPRSARGASMALTLRVAATFRLIRIGPPPRGGQIPCSHSRNACTTRPHIRFDAGAIGDIQANVEEIRSRFDEPRDTQRLEPLKPCVAPGDNVREHQGPDHSCDEKEHGTNLKWQAPNGQVFGKTFRKQVFSNACYRHAHGDTPDGISSTPRRECRTRPDLASSAREYG